MKTAIERITKQRAQLISQPAVFRHACATPPTRPERHDIQTMAVDGKQPVLQSELS
jgi:hypothetical protein